MSQDPMGFDAGDSNLYRYVNNRPEIEEDPSGLQSENFELPNGYRIYIEWWPGGNPPHGEASIWNAQNQQVERFVYRQGEGLFQPGSHGDGKPLPGISNNVWRKISLQVNYYLEIMVNRSSPTGRPIWNRTMTPPVVRQGFPANAFNGLAIYLTIRDAAVATGIVNMNEPRGRIDYTFVAGDGSVFVVSPGHSGSRLPWGDGPMSPQRIYIGGPKKGRTEQITSAAVQDYQKQGDSVWGKYNRGGLFGTDTFTPGTHRQIIPWTNILGRPIGWIDETGPHLFEEIPIPLGFRDAA